ncbi:hypothetical protein SETIT_3G400800v2 [Setaria italica]|uniref:NB-ARC domain-containing protein n=1 Tax=Setaria italica TaxID=4555 RepID=A0A368QP11_SETIT|nr:putative disease resistance RPP13-like protein 3 isoform X2 [Setaria italica]RCV19623.1 hypothetical protein SETIT_3G400800v2 [Setaria italica]
MEAAVVSASHGAMGSLLGKLGELLTAKYKLLKEAKGQIMFLKAELETMYVFLKKISDTEEPDEQDKHWAKEVRELSYDIDDSVSEFMLRVECDSSKPHGFKGFIVRSMKLMTTVNTRHEIAKEFEGLKNRVKEVSERRTRYKMDDVAPKSNNTAIDLRLLALHAETASLVGVTGPRDQLIQLMDAEGVSAHQLKVLSIVGFGGLGKTTLANEIYRKLEEKFQCQAFVSVSQKPNIRKILRTILSQVGFVPPKDTNIEMWEEPELISSVKKFLLDKRYLIVIDDIWDASAWYVIRCALPESMNGSRVITTTRIEAVARACSTNHIECVYKMKALSDQDSKRLFFKRIFGLEDACPSYLKEVSGEIVKKCGGLPLAIITISSLLANQSNKLKENWDYVRNSLGSNFEPSLEGMRQILSLSYTNLPYHLKACMLYLGIYPEDYTINKNDLARQWVAEGFIYKASATDPEDIAKNYFNDLVNRSMIQPADTDYNGEVISCKVHDMVLDLILHKSREENFVTVIDDIQDMTGHKDKIRRLSFNQDSVIDSRFMGSVQLSQTRTLARFGSSSRLPPFLQFKHLRVLIIETSRAIGPSPLLDFDRICHLFQLRCLKIVAEDYDAVLPSKIGDLQQLETFEVQLDYKFLQGRKSLKLPSDIVHLSRLLHLIVPVRTILPDGIGNMRSLHTVHRFNLANSLHSIKSLRELTNLTDLEIGFAGSIIDHEVVERGREVLHICFEKLCNLKYLKVNIFPSEAYLDAFSPIPASFRHLQRFHGSSFSRVPGWIGELHSIYDLVLTVQEVLEDDVGILAQLPSLIHLILHIRGAPKGYHT